MMAKAPSDCNPTLSEEPYAGNPHVRFRGGADPVTGRPTRSPAIVLFVDWLLDPGDEQPV